MKKLFIVSILFLSSAIGFAQDNMLTPVQYIEMYKDIAIREMKSPTLNAFPNVIRPLLYLSLKFLIPTKTKENATNMAV